MEVPYVEAAGLQCSAAILCSPGTGTRSGEWGAEACPGPQHFSLISSSWVSAHIWVFLAYFKQLTLPVQFQTVAPFPRGLDFTQTNRSLCIPPNFWMPRFLQLLTSNSALHTHTHRKSSTEFSRTSYAKINVQSWQSKFFLFWRMTDTMGKIPLCRHRVANLITWLSCYYHCNWQWDKTVFTWYTVYTFPGTTQYLFF